MLGKVPLHSVVNRITNRRLAKGLIEASTQRHAACLVEPYGTLYKPALEALPPSIRPDLEFLYKLDHAKSVSQTLGTGYYALLGKQMRWPHRSLRLNPYQQELLWALKHGEIKNPLQAIELCRSKFNIMDRNGNDRRILNSVRRELRNPTTQKGVDALFADGFRKQKSSEQWFLQILPNSDRESPRMIRAYGRRPSVVLREVFDYFADVVRPKSRVNTAAGRANRGAVTPPSPKVIR